MDSDQLASLINDQSKEPSLINSTTGLPNVSTSSTKVAVYSKPNRPKPYKLPFPIKGKHFAHDVDLCRTSKRNKLLK